jgi:hypothetical protein
MGKIVCFARNLGLTEDKYILPFVLKYKLPRLILEIHNHNTAEKLKKKGIAISCQPNNTDSITESLKWGCKTLKMMDTATLITSIYAFKNEEMELSNKLIKDISLVQITHGSDDRNILDKGYNILSGFPYFDLLLLDNNYWANLAKEVCGNKTKIN